MLHKKLKLTKIRDVRNIGVLRDTEVEERLNSLFFLLFFSFGVHSNRIISVILSLIIKLHLAYFELDFSMCFKLYEHKLKSLNLSIYEFFPGQPLSLWLFNLTNQRNS